MVHYCINNLMLSLIILTVPGMLWFFFIILLESNFVCWDQYLSYIFSASGTNQNTVKLRENE